MKKIISGIVLAGLGGIAALTASHFMFKTEPVSQVNNPNTPVILAGNSGAGVLNADFTLAAEKSLNAVVHIKTTVEQTNNISTPFEQWFYGHSRSQTYVQQGSGSGVIISADG